MVLQDIANIARPLTEEDVANIVTKADLQECMKCIEKVKEDITNIYKILATHPSKKKENNKSRKYCWTHGSCFHMGK